MDGDEAENVEMLRRIERERRELDEKVCALDFVLSFLFCF